MQELFQLFGELGIRTEKAFSKIDEIERKVRDLSNQFANDLTADISINDKASSALDNVGNEALEAIERLNQLEAVIKEFEAQLSDPLNLEVDVSTDGVMQTRAELRALLNEIDRVRRQAERDINVQASADVNMPPFPNSDYVTNQTTTQTTNQNTNVNIGGNFEQTSQEVESLQKQLAALQKQLRDLNNAGTTNINLNGMETNVEGLLKNLETVERELGRIEDKMQNINDTGLNIDGTVNVEQHSAFKDLSAEINGLSTTMAALTAATVAGAVRGPGAAVGGRAGRPMGYDVNRVFQQQMRMNQMMLRYVERLQPGNTAGRARMQLEIGGEAFGKMPMAKTMLEMQALFGMAQSGITSARRELSQLGFARLSRETKAFEGQLHMLGNVRLDNLKDQIKLTEKGIKEMKASANADEYIDEIQRMEKALVNYKKELKDADPFKQLARATGYDHDKVFGKDVFIKPWKTQLDKVGGQFNQFFNRDVAMLMNKAYNNIEGTANRIIGSQTSKMEQKQKIMQLQMRYMMLGQQINMFLTPAVLGLAAAFTMVGANAEKGWNKFQAQTITATKDMAEFKNMITDTGVATGASQEEVGEVFSVLHNQMGRTKDNIEEAATMGLYFKKVWGMEAVEAVASVDSIMEQLGVNTQQAQDILALALKKHQGDIEAATKDVLENEKAWIKVSEAGTEGAKAYEMMQEGIDYGAVESFLRAFRQMGAALLELWKQIEPTLTAIANRITKAAEATTEWLRNNPGMAKFIVHLGAIIGSLILLAGVFAPVAAVLLQFRGLFQGVAQAMGAARKGAVVMSPAVRMLMDTMKLTGNAIMGLPSMIMGVFPAALAMIRQLPAALAGGIVNFIRLNPVLSMIAGLVWVIQKNWEKFQPVLADIWDSIKRIGDAIFGAFAGPGGDAAEGFGNMMDMIAKIAGEILLPILKVLAVLIEGLAIIMENGGAKYVVAAGGMMLFGGALGRVIPMLGGLSTAVMALFGPFGKMFALAKGIGPMFRMMSTAALAMFGPFGRLFALLKGIGPMLMLGFSKLGPLLARIPALFAVVGRGLMMLGPLLLNPWTWVALAVAGIVFVVIKYWDDIKAGTIRVWNSIVDFLKNNWQTILMWVTGPFGMMVGMIAKHWDSIKAMAQSAWEGIKTILSQSWQGIVMLAKIIWDGIVQYFKDIWANIVKSAKSDMKALGDFLGFTWTDIKNFGIFIFEGLKIGITKAWNGLKKASIAIWKAIVNYIVGRWNGLKASVIFATKAIRNGIVSLWNNLKKMSVAIFKAIVDYIVGRWNGLKKSIVAITRAIRNGVVNLWNAMKSRIQSLTNTLKNAIIRAWQAIKTFVTNSARSIRDAVVKAFTTVRNIVSSVMRSVRNSVSSAFTWLVGKARAFIKNFVATLKGLWEGLKNMGKNAWQWGRDIMSGLVNGIQSMFKSVKKVVKSITDAIKDAFIKAFDIHSPSRVTMGYGVNIGEGLEIGMRDTVKMISKAWDALSGIIVQPDMVDADVNVNRAINDTMTTQIESAMAPNAGQSYSGVSAATGSVTNVSNSTTTNNGNQGGVQIAQATFQVNFEKAPQNEEEVTKFRRAIQDVVSNDLFGMAVRNV